jgi:hypothetical protein
MANEHSVLDTRTRPLPDKTVDDLWFDARVYAAYGSQWDRAEDSIALAMERQIASPEPMHDDVRDALRRVQESATLRPGIDDFEPFDGFASNHLGYGTAEDYWDTQRRFPYANKKREEQYRAMIKNLAAARNVIGRKVTL